MNAGSLAQRDMIGDSMIALATGPISASYFSTSARSA
jgi:hypothetical protein